MHGSLYAVLYELCTGIAPHESRGPHAIVKFMSRCKRLSLPDDVTLLADAKAAAKQLLAATKHSSDGNAPATQREGSLETNEHSTPSMSIGRLRVASGELLPTALHVLYDKLSNEEPEERPTAAGVANQLERVISGLPLLGGEQNNAGQLHDRHKNSDASPGGEEAATDEDATNNRIAATEASAAAATASASPAERVYKAATRRANDAAVAAAARVAAAEGREGQLQAQGNRAHLLAMASLAVGSSVVLWWSFYGKVQRKAA